MPQLDLISFLSQIFWFSLFFILFYLFVIKNLVPFLSRVFKIRAKKIAVAQATSAFLRGQDLKTAESTTELLFQKAFLGANTVFVSFSNKINGWINNELLSFNKNNAILNKKYLTVLGSVALQNQLILNNLQKPFSIKKSFPFIKKIAAKGLKKSKKK
jgi:hypothetical protein